MTRKNFLLVSIVFALGVIELYVWDYVGLPKIPWEHHFMLKAPTMGIGLVIGFFLFKD